MHEGSDNLLERLHWKVDRGRGFLTDPPPKPPMAGKGIYMSGPWIFSEISKKIVLEFNKSITDQLDKLEIQTFFKVINCINTQSQNKS